MRLNCAARSPVAKGNEGERENENFVRPGQTKHAFRLNEATKGCARCGVSWCVLVPFLSPIPKLLALDSRLPLNTFGSFCPNANPIEGDSTQSKHNLKKPQILRQFERENASCSSAPVFRSQQLKAGAFG